MVSWPSPSYNLRRNSPPFIRNNVPFIKRNLDARQSGTATRGRSLAAAADRRVRADARRNIDTLLETAMKVSPLPASTLRCGRSPRRPASASARSTAISRRAPTSSRPSSATRSTPARTPRLYWPPNMSRTRRCSMDAALCRLHRAKRGLATALHSGDPAFDALPAYFEKRLRPALQGLLRSAASAGCIRADVDAHDLLWAIASLCASHTRPGPRTFPAHGRHAGRRAALRRNSAAAVWRRLIDPNARCGAWLSRPLRRSTPPSIPALGWPTGNRAGR